MYSYGILSSTLPATVDSILSCIHGDAQYRLGKSKIFLSKGCYEQLQAKKKAAQAAERAKQERETAAQEAKTTPTHTVAKPDPLIQNDNSSDTPFTNLEEAPTSTSIRLNSSITERFGKLNLSWESASSRLLYKEAAEFLGCIEAYASQKAALLVSLQEMERLFWISSTSGTNATLQLNLAMLLGE